MMEMSYSELRQHLKHVIDIVTDRHEPAIITSHKKPKAVLLSYEDYLSLQETACIKDDIVIAACRYHYSK